MWLLLACMTLQSMPSVHDKAKPKTTRQNRPPTCPACVTLQICSARFVFGTHKYFCDVIVEHSSPFEHAPPMARVQLLWNILANVMANYWQKCMGFCLLPNFPGMYCFFPWKVIFLSCVLFFNICSFRHQSLYTPRKQANPIPGWIRGFLAYFLHSSPLT